MNILSQDIFIEVQIQRMRTEIRSTNDRLSSLPVATPVSKEDLKALHASLKATRSLAEETEKSFLLWTSQPT